LKEGAKKLKREYKAASIKLDAELWSLLSNNKDTIFDIKDWEVYRRATEISKEIPTEIVDKSLESTIERIINKMREYQREYGYFSSNRKISSVISFNIPRAL
jgi:chromosome condensin MukBEF complex kleisin-like MukF subunit